MFLGNHEIAEAIVAVIGSDSENAIWRQISPQKYYSCFHRCFVLSDGGL